MAAFRDYRIATWNLHVGRALPVVPRLLDGADPGVLALQEVNGAKRVRLLRGLVGKARVRASVNREAALVVTEGVRLRAVRRHALTLIGWERRAGRTGRHPRREAVSVRIGPRGRAGIRVLTVHIPPGPDTRPLRGKARAQALRRVERIAKRWNRATARGSIGGWMLVGDWNMTPNDPRIAALGGRLGARAVGNGVDFAVVSAGVYVASWHRLFWPAVSDHDPRVYDVRVEVAS